MTMSAAALSIDAIGRRRIVPGTTFTLDSETDGLLMAV